MWRHRFFKKKFLRSYFDERKHSLWSPTNHCVICSDFTVKQICFPEEEFQKHSVTVCTDVHRASPRKWERSGPRSACQAGNLQLQEAALGSSYPSTAPAPPKSDRISDSALSDSLTHPRVQAADLTQHLQGIRNEDTLPELLSCKSRAGCWQ